MKISAKIIVFNEEDNIAAACETLDWADEIVIVDSGSTDRTVEIARRYTDKIHFNEFENFRLQHQFADSKTSHDWIFWIDADERLSPELRESVLSVKESDGNGLPAGFRMKRRAWYLGRWIKHSGWYPDHVLRFYRKSDSKWGENIVHEDLNIEGKPGTLEGDLLHYTRRNLREQHDVIARYSELSSLQMFERGKRTGWSGFLFRPPAAFLESYVLKRGFLDGLAGLFIAYFRAYSVFLKYALLWERQSAGEQERRERDEGDS